MFNPLISVIVPVYRVEKYLPRCINSILNQTYTNFELILVDDGSPDNSGKICDDYALKDNRIKVIHKDNGGVSSARNTGIDAANGEYINFIDSDDWVPVDSLENLIAPILENSDIDLTVGNLELRAFKVVVKQFANNIISISDFKNGTVDLSLLIKEQFFGPVAKIYKTKILKEKKIEFPLNVKYGEDLLFNLTYLCNCKSFQTINKIVYYYNKLNEISATTKYEGIHQMPELYVMILKQYKKLFDLYKIQNLHQNTVLAKFAFSKFLYFTRMCIINLKKMEAIKQISNAILLLRDWIIKDNTIASTCELGEIYASVISFDAETIYVKYKKIIRRHKLKNDLLSLYIAFNKAYIEKKRDDLI